MLGSQGIKQKELEMPWAGSGAQCLLLGMFTGGL